MWLRILAGEFLPKEINKVLYVDADMLCLGDISKLYETDLSNYFIGAVQDINMGKEIPYFNSGLLLMNLKEIRKIFNEKLIKETIDKNKKTLKYPDQDVLNILCKDKTIFLDSNYNCQMGQGDKCYVKNPVIVHYIYSGKPWTHFHPSKYEKLWWDNLLSVSKKYFIKMQIFRVKKIISKKLKRI